jgi:hypothetical protein
MGDEKSVSKNSWNMEEDFESVDWKSVESHVRGLQISISKPSIKGKNNLARGSATFSCIPMTPNYWRSGRLRQTREGTLLGSTERFGLQTNRSSEQFSNWTPRDISPSYCVVYTYRKVTGSSGH